MTLSPTEDGGTDLHWRATPTRHLPGTARRRTAALEATVAGLAAQLSSAAEDPATTRAEWADARPDGATPPPLRTLTAVPAGDAVAAGPPRLHRACRGLHARCGMGDHRLMRPLVVQRSARRHVSIADG